MPTWFISRAYASCSGIRVNCPTQDKSHHCPGHRARAVSKGSELLIHPQNRPTQDKSHRFPGHRVRAVSKGSGLCRRVCAVVLRRQREGRRAGRQLPWVPGVGSLDDSHGSSRSQPQRLVPVGRTYRPPHGPASTGGHVT